MINYFITDLPFNLLVKKIKIGEHLPKLQAKMFDRVMRPICIKLLSWKMQNSLDK